jgi:hypothetical protein
MGAALSVVPKGGTMPTLKHPTSPTATVSVTEERAVKLRKRGYTDFEPQTPADVPVKPVDDDEAVALTQGQARVEAQIERLQGDAPDPSEPTTSAKDDSEKAEKPKSKPKSK